MAGEFLVYLKFLGFFRVSVPGAITDAKSLINCRYHLAEPRKLRAGFSESLFSIQRRFFSWSVPNASSPIINPKHLN